MDMLQVRGSAFRWEEVHTGMINGVQKDMLLMIWSQNQRHLLPSSFDANLLATNT